MGPNALKILIESNIPFVQGVLEPYAEVSYLAPGEFSPEAVRDADALIVRTRTRCDAALLSESGVSFIATATIGTDHIDLPWCASRGIAVANAPGCNAPAVAQYVLSAVRRLYTEPLSQCSIGIVGVGHVGSVIERWARQLGMRVLLNDPPRQVAEGGAGWSSLDEIAREADVITFHTPLDDSTRHMADSDFLSSLRRAPILVNAARGAVVDTAALVDAIDTGLVGKAVIDCWEDEPDISLALLNRASVATPHIAGYSREGKIRASRMAVDALTAHFGLPKVELAVSAPDGAAYAVTADLITESYDPFIDTAKLKSDPGAFETLRNRYDLRHEVR